MESLTNKSRTVLVTGTSSGIGRGLCQALIEKGYKVFGTVRNRKDATELKKEFGENLDALLVDVTDEKQVIKAKERVQNYLNGKHHCLNGRRHPPNVPVRPCATFGPLAGPLGGPTA